MISNQEITLPPSLNEKEYIFMADLAVLTNTIKNGQLVTLTFEVKGDAKITEYPITVNVEDDGKRPRV